MMILLYKRYSQEEMYFIKGSINLFLVFIIFSMIQYLNGMEVYNALKIIGAGFILMISIISIVELFKKIYNYLYEREKLEEERKRTKY